MTEFDIQYKSNNVYDEIVKEAIYEFCIVPCNDNTQIIIDYSTANSLAEPVFSYKNLYGFEISRIRTTKSFNEFTFEMKARLDKKFIPYLDYKMLSLQEEMDTLTSSDFFIEHHMFMTKTPYTFISSDNEGKIPKLANKHVLDFLHELNDYIHTGFHYQKDITDVRTTADEVLRIGSGVCQDFTHLFIAIARYNGIPARYVSGYLNQGKAFIGAMLMHAWVETFIPGAGWVGFDPTNKIMTDMNYIKVSHGTDYTDCSPIKGILKTTGENQTVYQVKVVEQQQQQQNIWALKP